MIATPPLYIIGVIHTLQNIPVNSTGSYPFLSWPKNQTITRDNAEVYISCVVHDCAHGAELIIGYTHNDNWTYEPASCLFQNGRNIDGIYIIEANVSLQNISSQQNPRMPMPVWCRVSGQKVTNTSYIHVINDQPPTTEPNTELPSSTMNCPCDLLIQTSSGGGNIYFFKPSTFRLTECLLLCMFIYVMIQNLIMR